MLSTRLQRTHKQFFCIVFSIRSGSTLLCEDLRSVGIGAPTEYFQTHLYRDRPASERVSDYIVQLVEATPGPAFGFKISWDQAYALSEALRLEGEHTDGLDLRAVFPGLRVVRVVREDKLLQAVSAWRAFETGVWHRPTGHAPPPVPREYDLVSIRQMFYELVAEDWQWQHFLSSRDIDHITITYEQYVRSRRSELERIAAHVGAPTPKVDPADRLVQMRDHVSAALAERLWAELQRPTAEWPAPAGPAIEAGPPRLIAPRWPATSASAAG